MRSNSMEPTPHLRSPQRMAAQTPQAYISTINFYCSQSPQLQSPLRKSESTALISKRKSRNQSTQRLTYLESKYRTLEDDYRRVLNEVQIRSQIFTKQKQQMQVFIQASVKDTKEIQRLTQLIRMTQKVDTSAQTREFQESTRRKRVEVSTGESEPASDEQLRTQARKVKKAKERTSFQGKDKFIPKLSFKNI